MCKIWYSNFVILNEVRPPSPATRNDKTKAFSFIISSVLFMLKKENDTTVHSSQWRTRVWCTLVKEGPPPVLVCFSTRQLPLRAAPWLTEEAAIRGSMALLEPCEMMKTGLKGARLPTRHFWRPTQCLLWSEEGGVRLPTKREAPWLGAS